MNDFRTADYVVGSIASLALAASVVAASLVYKLVVESSCPLNSTTNTPLKVRGGSMTVRTNDQWYPQKTSLNQKDPTCTNVRDASYIDFTDATSTSGGPLKLPKLKVPWQMAIYGRGFPGGHASKLGIKLSSSVGPCSGSTGLTNSVTVSLIDNTTTSFYPTSIDETATQSVRYWDQSNGCQGPGQPGNSSGSSGDEDVCERMSTITLTLNSGTPNTYNCDNGECIISIGKF